MHPKQIDSFFLQLSKEFPYRLIIILTGAACGSLWGNIRPSLDVDFAVQLLSAKGKSWQTFDEAIQRAIKLTGIQVNYAQDIDRWSSITLLDYRRHTHPYKRFKTLDVRLLDPLYWSIGKMGRYLDPDVKDLVEVFKKQKVSELKLINLWAKAAIKSPRSLAIGQFCQHVEHFMKVYGKEIWGKNFDSEKILKLFWKKVRIS